MTADSRNGAISHDAAKEAALRLIASAFGRDDNRARFSIPRRLDDDDILVIDYMDRLRFQLDRANKIIGWMMPYIGKMCPPSNGLYDLNIHCCENKVPEPSNETKGRPIQAEGRA